MSKSPRHAICVIDQAFSGGPASWGQKIEGLNFTPNYFIVREISWEGTVAVEGPAKVICNELGHLGCFSGGTQSTSNSSAMSTYSGGPLNGAELSFRICQGSSVLSMNGRIMLTLEFIYKRPKEESKE